jgi:MoxR-like ATPase
MDDTTDTTEAFADLTTDRLREVFESTDYVAGDDIVTTVYLALRMGKPLLVEGEPGAGKTELAKVLAAGFDAELVRLQCYEGLAAEHTLYEWNYTKQLLAVQSGRGDENVFTDEYLLERPLLQALRADDDVPPVLLIDEVDRADEEFEALLLEVLSEFQVSIPELGTLSATVPPVVVITSNRTRGLSDALKRRCLYLHVEPPSFEKEREIVQRKVPELDDAVAAAVCGVTARLREESLLKRPGVAETLDWARALSTLRDGTEAEPTGDPVIADEELENTLGCLLKEAEDVARVDEDLFAALVAAGRDAADDTTTTAEPEEGVKHDDADD